MKTWHSFMTSGLLLLALVGPSPYARAQGNVNADDFHDKLMQLGAGPEGGSFGPIGSTLCDTLNKVRNTTLVRCIPLRSAGSVFNVHAVANLINSKYKDMQAHRPYLASMQPMRQADLASLAVPMHPGALRALQERIP